jgi:hypothetical protein
VSQLSVPHPTLHLQVSVKTNVHDRHGDGSKEGEINATGINSAVPIMPHASKYYKIQGVP